MSALFSGMGTLTAGVHGSAVTVTPQGQPARTVQAVFREEPITVQHGDRDIITLMPTLRGPRDRMANLAPGTVVAPLNGKLYRVVGEMETKNPAPDGHVVLQLEKTGASQ